MSDLHLTGRLLDRLGLAKARPGLLRAYGLSGLADGAVNRRRHQLELAALRVVIAEFSEAIGDRAPWILLKGEPLEERLFGREIRRATGDVDVLVLPGDMELFRDGLRRLGYDRRQKPRRWAHNQEAWFHVKHRSVVELHWSAATPGIPAPPLHELFATPIPFDLQNGRASPTTVDVLDDHWLVAHLALHFHHHFGFAKGLLDIAGWCDRLAPKIDLGALRADLQRVGLWDILQWPLHAIALLLNELPPLFDTTASPAARALAILSARAMGDCLSRAPRSDFEATLIAAMPLVGPLRTLSLQAATMLLADDQGQPIPGLIRPFLLGPHRVGQIFNTLLL